MQIISQGGGKKFYAQPLSPKSDQMSKHFWEESAFQI